MKTRRLKAHEFVQVTALLSQAREDGVDFSTQTPRQIALNLAPKFPNITYLHVKEIAEVLGLTLAQSKSQKSGGKGVSLMMRRINDLEKRVEKIEEKVRYGIN